MTVSGNTILQATIMYTQPESSVIENVYHLYIGGAGSSAPDDDVLFVVKQWFEDIYGSIDAFFTTLMSSITLHLDVIAFTGGKWVLQRRVGSTTVNVTPQGAISMLPPANCVQLNMEPLVRKHVGRKYFGGLGLVVCDSQGDLAAAAGLAFADLAADLMSGFTIPGAPEDLNGQYVILDRTLGGYNQINTITIRGDIAVQRRRKQYVGM